MKKGKGKENSRYVSLSLYFNPNIKEDMDAYYFLMSTPRKKTTFIVKLVHKFLKDIGIQDVHNLSEQDKNNLIESLIYNYEGKVPSKKISLLSRPNKYINQNLLGSLLTDTSNIQPNCEKKVIIQKPETSEKINILVETIENKDTNKVEKLIDNIEETKITDGAMTLDDEEIENSEELIMNWKDGLEAFGI